MNTSTPLAAVATGLAAALTISLAATQPAEAIISPAYTNTPAYTVQQTGNWETMSNLPMVDALAVPGYGWRAGFRIRVGARWDSGLYYGTSAGSVEGRAQLWVDTGAGPATMRTSPALISISVVPAFNGQWLAGCQAHAGGWNQFDPVASHGGWACSAPTTGGPNTNYEMGTYSACIAVGGLAFADQPSSWFNAVGCPRPAVRI
jgi:hypothetical protein